MKGLKAMYTAGVKCTLHNTQYTLHTIHCTLHTTHLKYILNLGVTKISHEKNLFLDPRYFQTATRFFEEIITTKNQGLINQTH